MSLKQQTPHGGLLQTGAIKTYYYFYYYSYHFEDRLSLKVRPISLMAPVLCDRRYVFNSEERLENEGRSFRFKCQQLTASSWYSSGQCSGLVNLNPSRTLRCTSCVFNLPYGRAP
eukprot:m.115987 g.115987  ORF g.115987 m.115987 type:complete len:115 (-) comp9299_c0_seq1:2274-2618(-)